MKAQAPSVFARTCGAGTGERYLAVDLHKDYVVVGGVDGRQQGVLPARRLTLDAWPAWARKNLSQSDALVVEATTNAWDFYDQVAPLVGRAVVANAGKVKLIAAAQVTLALAGKCQGDGQGRCAGPGAVAGGRLHPGSVGAASGGARTAQSPGLPPAAD